MSRIYSHDRSEPFKFQLGVGQVIKGWDQGLIGICVGEKRQLQIPSALAYGDHAAGDKIPAGMSSNSLNVMAVPF